ncbi:MAG TPA: hypothetical protein VFH31_18335 [Pyrinomonadaceae bacterium]|nr:hypothetical protein [Pyrinomonadaceae bacterium]
MELRRDIFRFVLGSLVVVGVLALVRGWSRLPDYLLLIFGMAIVWVASGLLAEWLQKRRGTKGR